MDKRSIEEGRRQRELERAQRAQRGESVHSAGSGAGGRDGTPGAGAAQPGRQSERRREDRRDASPEAYRRPRNQRGEHVDAQAPRDDQGDDERREEEEDDDGMEDAQDDMAAMLGFGGFGSTKVSALPLDHVMILPDGIPCQQNQKVSGNVEGAAQIKQQRTWRQYMNRRGGFNRCVHRPGRKSTSKVSDLISLIRLTDLWIRSKSPRSGTECGRLRLTGCRTAELEISFVRVLGRGIE